MGFGGARPTSLTRTGHVPVRVEDEVGTARRRCHARVEPIMTR